MKKIFASLIFILSFINSLFSQNITLNELKYNDKSGKGTVICTFTLKDGIDYDFDDFDFVIGKILVTISNDFIINDHLWKNGDTILKKMKNNKYYLKTKIHINDEYVSDILSGYIKIGSEKLDFNLEPQKISYSYKQINNNETDKILIYPYSDIFDSSNFEEAKKAFSLSDGYFYYIFRDEGDPENNSDMWNNAKYLYTLNKKCKIIKFFQCVNDVYNLEEAIESQKHYDSYIDKLKNIYNIQIDDIYYIANPTDSDLKRFYEYKPNGILLTEKDVVFIRTYNYKLLKKYYKKYYH